MSEGKRLYVGNLAFDCAWYDLKDHFKSCGNVVRADIMEEHGGRSKGCGIVEFALAEEAQLAIATLNDTDLKGRPIFVREDRETSVTASGRGSAQNRRSAQSLASELKGRPFGREDREASSSTSALPGGSGGGGDSRRLYVGNLAFDCAWYDLKDLFKTCGNVVRADILMGADNRSKGCGIVEFALAEEAQLAIATLNDTELKGRPIFVREDRETNALGQGAPVAGRRLYVGNLAFSVAWYDLKDFFKACGNVVRADVLMGADNRSKGCGIVEFSLPEEAQLAITTLNDTELKGRTIFVREDRELATPAPPRSSYSSTAGGGDTPASTLGTRVFVGNLAWDIGWPQLKDHFKSAGVVAHADVPTDDDGRSRGYGIVEYKQAKDALYAIHTLNGTTLGGRAIKLREYGDN